MEIRYLKLGRRGVWEKACIEQEQTLRLGYESPHHQDSLNGNWEAVEDHWLQVRNGDRGAARRDVGQIKDFYELLESDIWITFYRGRMYWCHAHKEVHELNDGSRIRYVIGEWSSKDKKENPLLIENIDGRVTKVQGFRGTICTVESPEYVRRKIEGELQPEVETAKQALHELESKIEDLIKGLWWKDFELLIDLIFSRAGWQRVSLLGKTQKDIDLDMFSPITQKRAFVQIKSKANHRQLKTYQDVFNQYGQYDEMYFVFHTPSKNLKQATTSDPRVGIWDVSRVAKLVVQTGTADWLINKSS